jgi:hypothetical protein
MQGCTGHSDALRRIFLPILAIGLTGCLQKEESANVDPSNDSELQHDHELTGSVGDGPIVGASMRVLANDGTTLAALESDSNAGYNIIVRTKGKLYPLTIDARSGIDLVTNLVPDFDLSGTVIEPSKKSVANLNPFSTIAVELARNLSGGITKANLLAAEDIVSRELNSGLDSLAESGSMATPIDASNIAEIIKASETLGETVRRVRDLQISTRGASTGNSVVKNLASDLVDGVIDGIGGANTDARVAALTIVVSAQTLLESMQVELHVNDQDATSSMESAMNAVSPGGSEKSFGDLTVTAEMLDAVRVGLDACLAVVPSPDLQVLADAVGSVQVGMAPITIRSLVPNTYRETLESAIITIANGTDADIETVNSVSRSGGGTWGASNAAPVISGVPSTKVEEGRAYTFTPTANDPDGDTLTFIISSQPAWATFDSTTGTLSGIPRTGSVGDYTNIVIGVTDGEFVAELPAFAITVTAFAPANSPPTISGTPQASVEVGRSYSFQPTADDPDGDALKFTISGQPAWTTFESATGLLSGTPAIGDENVYGNIIIGVSDGEFTDSLGPFSIEVLSSGTGLGSITLSWTAPTQNEDGSALTDLAGYKLYWGTTPGVYTQTATIDSPGITTFTVDGLPPGEYEFVAKSFNTAGIESAYSNTATKTVP